MRDVVAANKNFIEKPSFPNSMNRMNTYCISIVWCFVISIRWLNLKDTDFFWVTSTKKNWSTFLSPQIKYFPYFFFWCICYFQKKSNKFEWYTLVRNAYTILCQWTNIITNQPSNYTYNNRMTSSPTHTLEHFCCTVYATHGLTCIWEALESHIFFSKLNNRKQRTVLTHTVWDRRREESQSKWARALDILLGNNT